MPGFQLGPGVVVDPDRREAYVMSPDGGIVAVDIARGARLWRSDQADRPLAVSGDLLVGQAPAAGPADPLRIVTLHTGERGRQVAEALVELPAGVQPMIAAQRNRSFTARATPRDDAVDISWEFVERPLRGTAPGPVEVLPGETPPAATAGAPPSRGPAPAGPPASVAGALPGPGAAEVTVVRGEARVELASGRVTSNEATRAPAAADGPSVAGDEGAGTAGRAREVAPDAVVPGLPEPQFLSADGRHVMSSERVADDPEWDTYRWTIVERDGGRRVGELRTRLRFAPFLVSDSLVVYQMPAHARRQGRRMVTEQVQLRADDVTSGERVWSQPVRDVTDRRPPPP